MSLNKFLRKQFLLVALESSFLAVACSAADRIVTQPETASTDGKYGRLLVNADLTIAAGVSVECETLCIASNIVGAAKLTLEEGARLTVTSEAAGSVLLGAAGGQAYLELKSGSVMTADGINGAYGYQGSAGVEPTRSFVVVSNATLKLNGAYTSGSSKNRNGLQFAGGGIWPSGTTKTDVVDTLRLDDGAVLSVCRIAKSSAQAAKIIFNGGKIVQTLAPSVSASTSYVYMPSGSKQSPFYFESTNGCPVLIEMSGNDSVSSMFDFGSKECRVHIVGDGDFVKDGAVSLSLVNGGSSYWNNDVPNLCLVHKGKCRVMGGGRLSIGASNVCTNNGVYAESRDWVVEDGAIFDLGGKNALMKSICLGSGGVLTNSSAAVSELALGDGNVDVIYPAALASKINIRKVGTGTLSLYAENVENLAVESGSLKMMSRAEMGYSFYKFNLYKTRDDPEPNRKMRIAEFKFLDGTNDVTQGWDAYYYSNRETSYYNEPTNMWDGDLTTHFYDQRAQRWDTISNIHTEVEYWPARRMTGYTWATSSSAYTKDSDPIAWEMFGSMDNKNWTSLDYVEDYDPTTTRGQWVSTNFVFHYETTAATIGKVALAAGAKLVACGANLTFSTAEMEDGAVLSLGAGGVLTLPANTVLGDVEVDMDSSKMTQVSGFVPAPTGRLSIVGRAAGLRKPLPVTFIDLPDGVWSDWTVERDGVVLDYVPRITSGRLCLQSTRGLILLLK